jgi:GMP reductase
MYSNKVNRMTKLDFKDVMMVPLEVSNIKSRKDVKLMNNYYFESNSINCIPIVASNMEGIGTIRMYKELSKHGIITCFTKQTTLDELLSIELNRDLYILSSGITVKDMIDIENKVNTLKPKMVCFDVANGYMEGFIKKVGIFKSLYPELIIIAGNVVSSSVLEEYKKIGVDIVKIGIGSGSVCTTRLKTGIGYPQFSAINDIKETAKRLNMYVMSDGGIQHPGDAAKAFGIGADFVMIGGMLSGHDECFTDDQLQNMNENETIHFYGNSSNEALNKYHGGTQNYRTNEGKCVSVKRKGPVINTVNDLLGGIRSSCTYLNCSHLNELYLKSSFITVKHYVNNMFN